MDCRKSGPAKHRTEAKSNFEQFCYYGKSKKDRLFHKFLAKKVDQNENSLVFQIDSVINVTKNDETKIYKAVQELKNLVIQSMEIKETVINQKFQSNLNSLIETRNRNKKWKKTSISSLITTLVNQKKESTRRKKKNIEHDKNKGMKFLDQHILQRGKGRRFA